MGRQIITNTTCAFCDKTFDVATEDLEWEHLKNVGETDEDPQLFDYSISQKLNCPHCDKDNEVLITMKGKNEADIDLSTTKVVNFSEIRNSLDSL